LRGQRRMVELEGSFLISLRGMLILQYADNTILFMEHNLEKAVNMKLILSDEG
jgi:hypothetical protein